MAVDTYHYIDVAGERVVVQDPHTLRYMMKDWTQPRMEAHA